MAVDFDAFLRWCEDRFYDIQVSGNEIKINSIFKENDQDHKLWCNPCGGKKGIDLGVYHCWKTEKRGNLAGLIMLVDNCSFKEALDILGGNDGGSFEELQAMVEDFFVKEQAPKVEEEIKLELPPFTYRLTDMPEDNPYRHRAEEYLKGRKIPINGLYVATAGRYRNRIVIPYYDPNGRLIYYNCRAMSGEEPKYLGPPKELGIGKGDVVYMSEWPPEGSKVYVMEGEFDAITLWVCGLYSAALGGKNLSDTQLEMLRKYKIVIAIDNDGAGRQALLIMGETLFKEGFELGFVRPPEDFKDWNALLEKYNEEVVRGYIQYNEKPFTRNTIVELLDQGFDYE